MIAAPWLFGFATGGAAQWAAIVFGAGAILYSLLTAYELGAVRIIPMEAHLLLDGVAGAALAISPWLFGFAGQTYAPHLAFGVFSVVASLITHRHPSNPIHAHSRA